MTFSVGTYSTLHTTKNKIDFNMKKKGKTK